MGRLDEIAAWLGPESALGEPEAMRTCRELLARLRVLREALESLQDSIRPGLERFRSSPNATEQMIVAAYDKARTALDYLDGDA